MQIDRHEIDLFCGFRNRGGALPCSYGRPVWGVAPVRAMRDAGVKPGLGADGSVPNDSTNRVAARSAMLLPLMTRGAAAMSVCAAL